MANENSNPQIVLDAILETPKTFGDVIINDISILRYAYLEKLQSPFVDPSKEFNVENIVPSIFVLAVDKKELRKYNSDIEALKLDALDWADEKLKLDDIPAIINAVIQKMTQMNKAAPNSAGNSDAKKN